MRLTPSLAACSLAVLLVTACSGGAGEPAGSPAPSAPPAPSSAAPSSAAPSEPPSADPDRALGWGPTAAELATARDLVAGWPAERLAGQVIVGRYAGSDPAVAARLVRDLHLAGVSVTNGNVVDAAQVRATTAAVSAAVAADGRDFPAVLGVDQEGGSVEHLRGIATTFPPFVYAGAAVSADPRAGARSVAQAATATGLELRDYGFTWVFAPVADVTIGSADPTIGSRSPSTDPAVAGRAVAAAVRGFNAAGIVSSTKHFPGHGAVTVNSHEALPVLESSLEEIRAHDLPPFTAALEAHAPAVMMAHIDVRAIAPGLPGSVAPRMYDFLRDDLGFEGVTITDSMGMGGVLGRPRPTVQALKAGADLILMPVDTTVAHTLITEAIESGEVPRERAEDAAARVVAVQLWQQRAAGRAPVPPDVTTRAQQAAARLVDAGS